MGVGAAIVHDGVAAVIVRHADDVDETGADHGGPAAVVTHVTIGSAVEPSNRLVVCDFVVTECDEGIFLGDADDSILLPAPGPTTRVLVTADDVPPSGLDEFWIELVPADYPSSALSERVVP
ncbi:MAG: hypothetical protein J0G30_07300 [Actinomycetales bacterium]|nr:hypothetical protein [Actinomycetales bacterium]